MSRGRDARGEPGQPQPPLLEAKLSVPHRRAGSVRRTRLLRQLRGAHRIVQVIAPPGYGKTSVLAQLAADARSVAWLTADDGDNDPVVLFTYLAAALDRLEPLDPDVFAAIASGAMTTRATIGQLVSAVAARAPLLMVIDDTHRINHRACLDALAQFVAYVPAGSQVALAARGPIGLPVARWRADGSLVEIGPAELAMDVEEATKLVRQLGFRLPDDVLQRLTRRTEGWPALLVLAATAYGRSSGHELAEVLGHERTIADYLRSEVLQQRSVSDIDFLTRTSILERLTGPACDAVMGRPGSGELLAEHGGALRSCWTTTAGRTDITRCCGTSCRTSSRCANLEQPARCMVERRDGTRRRVTSTWRWSMPSPPTSSTTRQPWWVSGSFATTGRGAV